MSETRQQHWCERCGGVILPLSDATMVDGKPYHPTQLCDPSAAPRREDAAGERVESEKRLHADPNCAFWLGNPDECTCRVPATPRREAGAERDDDSTPIRRAVGEVLMAAAHHKIASPECAQAVEKLVELHLAALSTAERDAKRWRYVKAGLFVTPHPDGEVEVVYQSGHLDEIAQQMWPNLEKGRRGIAWDVTPVVDAALARVPSGGEEGR